MTALFDQIAAGKYVLLTTFRKDGTPKPLPIWAARDGGELLIWTVGDSWKVKRIRNTPRVTVQACDARGKKPFGPVVEGTAAVLDAAGTERARAAIVKKYGVVGWLIVTGSNLRGKDRTVGLSITEAA
ncbi:MAG: PPOX class F420-dependent oxidoreductase [Segniliparus sp.]|uniref:PPOX class F420-dependent oxidoreductase n=1 Tax=Segniliparus sp. TaxID=2804064 RepID=UPI003F3B132F